MRTAISFITLLVIIPLWMPPTMASLVAFDCRTEEINKTAISLVQLPECLPSLAKPQVVKQNLVISQTEQRRRIQIERCLVTLRHLVYRCGYVSDTPRLIYSEVHNMPREDCHRLIRDNEIQLPGQQQILYKFPVKGSRQTHSYQSWGGFGSSSCDSASTLVIKDTSYKYAERITELEATFTEHFAQLEIESGKLILPSGERCDYREESCTTASYGNIYWRYETPECSSETPKVIVYKGLGEVITVRDKRNKTEQFVQVHHNNYDFQIKMDTDNSDSVCGFPSRRTEHPDLFVTLLDLGSPSFPNLREVNAENVNLITYINSKLVYSMRHTKEQVERLFELFQQERCTMQNRITQNLQTLALLSPREFAYQYFGKPGYTAVARGETIYAAQCKSVAVYPLPASPTTCYNELVVSYNNQTWFMTPRTRILISEGTIIPCSAEFAPLYHLGTRWVNQNPLGLSAVRDPEIIQYDHESYEFENMKNLANGGLYTPEVLKEYQKILTSPMEEAVITARLTDSLRGQSKLPAGYSYSRGLTEEDFEYIGQKVSWSHYAFKLGGWFGSFLLVKTIFQGIIKLVDVFSNFQQVRREKGTLVALFVCLFNSLSHLILMGRWKPSSEPVRQTDVEQGSEELPLRRMYNHSGV